uniref:Uncharacterized protein n=1 Tax=Knipowitschia caucasica TaxID=637954 RepID=A0AAV2MCL3_KNICA
MAVFIHSLSSLISSITSSTGQGQHKDPQQSPAAGPSPRTPLSTLRQAREWECASASPPKPPLLEGLDEGHEDNSALYL